MRAEWIRGLVAGTLLASVIGVVPIPGGASEPAGAEETTQVPAQWLTKLNTEALGTVPTAAGWAWVSALYGALPCDVDSLSLLGTAVYQQSAFTDLDYDNVERISALVRGALNRDATALDIAFLLPGLDAGTLQWDDLVDAVFDTAAFAALVPSICSSSASDYGWDGVGGVDLRAAAGQSPSRTQAQLQAALDAAQPGCGVVQLASHEFVVLGGAQPDGPDDVGLRVPACVTLETVGAPTVAEYAAMGRLSVGGPICDTDGCATAAAVTVGDGATLRNVWVDGSAGPDSVAGLSLVASDSGSQSTSVSEVRLTDPSPGGAAVDLRGWATEGIECAGRTFADSLITAYGRSDDQTGLGGPLWSDGVRVQCEDALVSGNAFVDLPGTAVSVMGSWNSASGNTGVEARRTQTSAVSGNVILNAGASGQVGIEVDPAGYCRAEDVGPPVPCIEFSDVRNDTPTLSPVRDFTGMSIDGNSIWTSEDAHLDVGVLVGGFARFGQNAPVGEHIALTGNDTGGIGLRAQTAVLVSGALQVLLSGNDWSGVTPASAGGHWDGGCAAGTVVAGFYAANFAPGSSLPTWVHPFDTMTCQIPTPPSAGREPIVASGSELVGAVSGETFTPWGHNYALTHVQTRSEMVMVRNLGTNTLRIHPQFRDIMDANCQPDPVALAELRQTADDAAEIGIYLDVTGLGSFAGDPSDPACYRDAPTRQDRWDAQADFWAAVAGALVDHPAVLMFDLMNEPILRAYPTPSPCWTGDPALADPLPEGCFGDLAEYYFVQNLNRESTLNPEAGVEWLTELTGAIRTVDPDRMITVGCLPFQNCGIGVGIPDLAAHLDILSVHIYPRDCTAAANPEEPCSPYGGGVEPPGEPLQFELGLAGAFAAPGKPVIVEEIFPLSSGTPLVDDFIQTANASGVVDGWIGQWEEGSRLSSQRIEPGPYYPDILPAPYAWYDWGRLFQRLTHSVAPCPGCAG